MTYTTVSQTYPVSIFTSKRNGDSARNNSVPSESSATPDENTSRFFSPASRANLNNPSHMPIAATGIMRFAVCDMMFASEYCAGDSIAVYSGRSRYTRTFDEKVPTARITVLERSRLYLFMASYAGNIIPRRSSPSYGKRS